MRRMTNKCYLNLLTLYMHCIEKLRLKTALTHIENEIEKTTHIKKHEIEHCIEQLRLKTASTEIKKWD